MLAKVSAFASILVVLLGTVFLGGCIPPDKQPSVFAVVLDVTGSTDAEGRALAFEGIRKWFEQKRIQRGDTIIVIPVTGDALTETQGRVLRFHLNKNRSTYEQDQRNLLNEVTTRLEKMEEEAATNPYKYSDILGALGLAAEELGRHKAARRLLIVLSDFIQDDRQINFNVAPQLASRAGAVSYAKGLAESRPINFGADVVYFGWLRSKDLKTMSASRREAMQAFWEEYLRCQGVTNLITAVDGPGAIDSVFNKADLAD